MNKNIYICKTFIGSLLSILLLLGACSDEYPTTGAIENGKVTLNLSLSIPGLSSIGTRAMSASQESAIDDTKIQVLIFENTGTSEVFRYQATITNKSLPKITLKVPSSSNKYRLVILTNMDSQTIADGTTKEIALQNFTFNCLGKWNAVSANPSKFPMWGELGSLITFKNDQSLSILLHRAIARVDVGVLFKFNNPDPVTGLEYEQKESDKESVYGMDKFKIKDIRVYRTLSKAYAASSSDRMTGNEVTTPNIPASTKYNSNSGTEYTTLADVDQYPLIYELSSGGNSYIREIYIPESGIINASSNMDNVPCLVIGGYYGAGNNTNVTYYRADFATYNNGAVAAYRPILRNHQYVFDIKNVNGPGFEEPEQALHSITSPMQLNVIDWNQVPLGFYVQGHYYVSVEERNIWLEARPLSGTTDITYTLPFASNLDIDGTDSKKFDLTWGKPEALRPFEVNVDYVNKTFTFTANQSNIAPDGGILTDVLTVKVENLQFTITVNQKWFNVSYQLDCSSVEVHGKFREDVPLNYSNYISMKVSSSTNINGVEYEVRTLEKNGIYFLAKGTFENPTGTAPYVYTLKLEGHGTPINTTEEKVLQPFDVTIVSNSIDAAECSTRIIMGYKTKRILTIGANAIYRYGYMLEPNTASRAFMDASVNFGTAPSSTVTMESNEYGNAFTIEVMTAGKGMIGEVLQYTYLKDKLNTFKPDIILTGQAINYNASGGDAIQLLSNFVDAGGVFLMCNEYYPVAASINAMVQKIMGTEVIGNNQSIGSALLFTLDGNIDDPITNGSFGDMRGKQWGSDGHEMHGFTNLPTGTIVYSNRSNGAANMFRHATKPFFFMGEGGFISNPQRYIGGAYQGSYVYCPFAIDASYRPIPRTNYTSSRVSVYNSQIFGNIIAWAVDYSENNGITYPATGNKFP